MASKVTWQDELLFPSDYLGAFDCNGKDLTLTIASVSKQELQIRGGGKKIKPVLAFKDHKKKIVLNVTNADSIAVMYGTKAESWVGKSVTFYPTKTHCGRETVDCIRVREKAPGPTSQHATTTETGRRLAEDTVANWLGALAKASDLEKFKTNGKQLPGLIDQLERDGFTDLAEKLRTAAHETEMRLTF